MTTITDALEQLANAMQSVALNRDRGPDGSWLTLVEVLLQFSSARAGDVVGDAFVLQADAHAAAVAIIENRAPTAQAETGVVEDLVALIAETFQQRSTGSEPEDSATAALIAHAVAEAVDTKCYQHFPAWFRGTLEVVLRPNGAFLPQRYDPRRYLGERSANTRPAHLPTTALDATEHVRLAPKEASHYRIVLDRDSYFHAHGLLAASPLAFAAVNPYQHLDEWLLDRSEEQGTYRNLGPAQKGQDAIERHVRAIRSAASEAPVVLLPEYAVHEDDDEALVEQLARAGGPPLVVYGTTVREEAGLRNVARIVFGADSGRALVREHTKFHPSEIPEVGREDIHVPRREVRVYVAGDLAIAVLVCRDAADGALLELLGVVGVNILLVPCMSARMASIVDTATGLRSSSQAFVALANTPARWRSDKHPDLTSDRPRVEAAFAAPYEDPPRVWQTLVEAGDETPATENPQETGVATVAERGEPPAPGRWTFNPETMQVIWRRED